MTPLTDEKSFDTLYQDFEEILEDYIIKQEKKKIPKTLPAPTQSQMDELNRGIIEYNKQFDIGG